MSEVTYLHQVAWPAVIRDAGLDPEKTNVDRSAIALSHPVGATGATLAIKFMRALERIDGRRAIVTMCIEGGQARQPSSNAPDGIFSPESLPHRGGSKRRRKARSTCCDGQQ